MGRARVLVPLALLACCACSSSDAPEKSEDPADDICRDAGDAGDAPDRGDSGDGHKQMDGGRAVGADGGAACPDPSEDSCQFDAGVMPSDVEPVYTRCVAPAPPPSAGPVVLEPAFGGTPIDFPTAMIPHPSGGFLVLDARGYVLFFEELSDASPDMWLDLSARVLGPDTNIETGLVGATFHPTGDALFLTYTGAPPESDTDHRATMVLERFALQDGQPTSDEGKRLLEVPLPTYHHHSGTLAFGDDGYLYMSLGEGGDSTNAQDRSSLLGSILRLDVDHGDPYAIPDTNPYVDQADFRAEIFAYGLRNPWKMSFDRETGQLWVADVGFRTEEEIDLIEVGGNYGWRPMEGDVCWGGDCEQYQAPIYSYPHSDGCSITGGFVYRGSKIRSLRGKYLFADFCGQWIHALAESGDAELVTDIEGAPTTFAEDEDGELYVLTQGGPVMRLAANPDVGKTNGFPTLLSETGCVHPDAPREMSAALVPYDVAVPLWSDAAAKRRFLSLPEDAKIEIDDSGQLAYPVGTVFVKEFARCNKLLETRLFMRHPDGHWAGYSYRWKEDQSDAELLATSVVATLGETATWWYPSRTQCLQCHNAEVGPVLGPRIEQLTSARPGDKGDVLADWIKRDLIDGDVEHARDKRAAFARHDDEEASLDERARAYLDVNCSSCHHDLEAGHARLDLRRGVDLTNTGVCAPAGNSFGAPMGSQDMDIIAAGEPDRSGLLVRMESESRGRMPKWSRVPDPDGTALVRSWVESLDTCPMPELAAEAQE